MEKEYEKSYTWVIKNFSSLQTKEIYSNQFVNGGCKWWLSVHPKGYKGAKYLSLYLGVPDFESLPSGWKRHVKFSFTIVNQLQKKLSQRKETQQWFDQKIRHWGFPELITLTKLHARDGGFLVNGELMVVVEIEVLEVICESNVIEETLPIIESINVNGFHVFSSQEESVNHLFDRHPDIASNFRPKNQLLKTAYMTLLLNVIKTLSQSSLEVSVGDLADASTAVISLKVAGFKLDWLEKKLEEIKENKERAVAAETRMHEIDEKLKDLKYKFSDLEALLVKEKADLLASSASLNRMIFSDDLYLLDSTSS